MCLLCAVPKLMTFRMFRKQTSQTSQRVSRQRNVWIEIKARKIVNIPTMLLCLRMGGDHGILFKIMGVGRNSLKFWSRRDKEVCSVGTVSDRKTLPLFLCLLSVCLFLYFHCVTALEDHKKTGRQISLHKNIEVAIENSYLCKKLRNVHIWVPVKVRAEKSKKNVTHKSYRSILKPCYNVHVSRSLLRNDQHVQREMVAVRPGFRVV